MSTFSTCITEEFKNITFGDKRLDKRFVDIMKTLEASPSGIISQTFNDAKEQKAAYRFLENDKVCFQSMLSSHQKSIKGKAEEASVVLAIQDSTVAYLPGAAKVADIDRIGNLRKGHPGLNIHSTLLVIPDKEILGIGDIHCFKRKLIEKKNKTHEKLPALKKETGKWLRAISNTRRGVSQTAKLVWVADREGDFWDYFSEMQEKQEVFVQRVVHKREMAEGNENYFDYVKQQPIIGYHAFEIPSKGGTQARSARHVKCEVRSAEIILKKPMGLPREIKSLKVRVIHVVDIEKHAGIEWFLLTNISCKTFEEIEEKIKWYEHRWIIEELHKVVKSGCGIEEMRLGSLNKLMKQLFLLFIVGKRILWMTKLAKECGEEKCSRVFSEEEWKFLYIRKYRKNPDREPTIKEAVRLLAIFGGFYEYNTKRDPGAMTIWRGMRRLKEVLAGFEILKNNDC